MEFSNQALFTYMFTSLKSSEVFFCCHQLSISRIVSNLCLCARPFACVLVRLHHTKKMGTHSLLHSTAKGQKIHRLPLSSQLIRSELKSCQSHVVTLLQLLLLLIKLSVHCSESSKPTYCMTSWGCQNPSWEMLESRVCQSPMSSGLRRVLCGSNIRSSNPAFAAGHSLCLSPCFLSHSTVLSTEGKMPK